MTPTLTLYTAPWCQPCKAFKPKLQALANELGVPLHLHNVEDNGTPLEVTGMPTTLLEHDGERTFFAGSNLAPIKATLLEMMK